WYESLNNFQNWSCIEFKRPINIFQLLPDNLYKQVFKSVGKRILYNDVEDYNSPNYLHKHGLPIIYELNNTPPHILKVIQNEDADCDIFATVIDAKNERKIFYNCQILKAPEEKPKIIVYGIQKNLRSFELKLKIKIMVIGHDTDFNFINSDNTDNSVQIENNVYDSQVPCEFSSMP